MTKPRIAVIGTGNMGSAIATALDRTGTAEVLAYNRTREKALKAAEGTSITVLDRIEDAGRTDAVIIALKPQVMQGEFGSLKKLESGLFISLAAGITLDTLKEKLSTGNVARFMPNIAARVSSSVTAVTYPESLDEEKKRLSLSVASSFGSAFVLDESLFNAFIGISGSAIAFVYEFMHSLSLGGVREGMPYNTALDIVRDTMESAVALQKSTSKGAIELETMVCSPKGTTIEGLKKLKEMNFENAVIEAVSASSAKAQNLEKGR